MISFPFDGRPFVDQLCPTFERSMSSCLRRRRRRRRISRSLPAVRVRKGEKISRSGQRRGTAVNGEEDLAGIKGGRMEERKTAFLPREFSVTLKSVFVPSDSHVPVEVHAPAGMQIAPLRMHRAYDSLSSFLFPSHFFAPTTYAYFVFRIIDPIRG